MYAVMCAATADEADALRLLEDAAFTARLFAAMEDHERTLHLEKLWAAIHFVLSGSTRIAAAGPPFDFLRPGGGGAAVGPDLGHGRPRLLTPAMVRAIAEAVEGIPRDVLDARLASPELAHVHPFTGAAVDAASSGRVLVEAAARIAGEDAAEELVARVMPPRGARPTAAERADVREGLEELQAFLAKLVRAGSGALVSIA